MNDCGTDTDHEIKRNDQCRRFLIIGDCLGPMPYMNSVMLLSQVQFGGHFAILKAYELGPAKQHILPQRQWNRSKLATRGRRPTQPRNANVGSRPDRRQTRPPNLYFCRICLEVPRVHWKIRPSPPKQPGHAAHRHFAVNPRMKLHRVCPSMLPAYNSGAWKRTLKQGRQTCITFDDTDPAHPQQILKA